MNSFKYEYSEVFTILSDAFKEGKLTNQEKLRIKQLILIRCHSIEKIISDFHQHYNKEKLIKEFKSYIGNQLSPTITCQSEFRNKNNDSFSSKISTRNNSCEGLSSPQDSALVQKKRIKGKKRTTSEFEEKSEDELRVIVIKKNSDVSETVRQCDIGHSPNIFNNRYSSYDDRHDFDKDF